MRRPREEGGGGRESPQNPYLESQARRTRTLIWWVERGQERTQAREPRREPSGVDRVDLGGLPNPKGSSCGGQFSSCGREEPETLLQRARPNPNPNPRNTVRRGREGSEARGPRGERSNPIEREGQAGVRVWLRRGLREGINPWLGPILYDDRRGVWLGLRERVNPREQFLWAPRKARRCG